MATALSSAYVLLGKATMSDPPEWSTGVGAIHTLSSLLTCAGCHTTIRDTPHGTPDDSFSLYCDKCQESSITSKYKTDVFSRLFFAKYFLVKLKLSAAEQFNIAAFSRLFPLNYFCIFPVKLKLSTFFFTTFLNQILLSREIEVVSSQTVPNR